MPKQPDPGITPHNWTYSWTTDIHHTQWCYAIAKTDGSIDSKTVTGILPRQEIERILGGEYELLELSDSTCLAVRVDRDTLSLPTNPHYQHGVRGNAVVGKLRDGNFLGLLGVQAEEPPV